MNWNIEEIKTAYNKLNDKTDPNTGYKIYFSAYTFLRAIGWDKVEYDNYCLKLKADDIVPKQKEVFQYIYDKVQDILADLMDLSIRNPKMTASAKTQFELFQPAFGREKQAQQYYSDIQRYKDIKEAQNKSPISILNNGKK